METGTGDDGRTRARVSALLLQHGPQTASELADRLHLSPAGVRRHLDALVAAGRVEERAVPGQRRGRGRPARRFALTESGRSSFPHAYDDLALTALRWAAAAGGPEAVRSIAEAQLAGLEQRCSSAVEAADVAPVERARVLAGALTAEGYAASASAISSGGQLCQLHCPVAHVAAEFPQLCEAETAVIGRLVGTHVQRLATIAHGDGICTTHIPGPLHRTAAGHPADHSTDHMADHTAPDHTVAGNRSPAVGPVPSRSHRPTSPTSRERTHA